MERARGATPMAALEQVAHDCIIAALTELLTVDTDGKLLLETSELDEIMHERKYASSFLARVEKDLPSDMDEWPIRDKQTVAKTLYERVLARVYFSHRIYSVDGIAADPAFANGIAQLHMHAIAGGASAELNRWLRAQITWLVNFLTTLHENSDVSSVESESSETMASEDEHVSVASEASAPHYENMP